MAQIVGRQAGKRLAAEQTLVDLTQKIDRLGQVNLAAIDEFKEQSERKEYLDRQFKDLTEALETLESAIRKIDRETRARFQDTFDRVNAGLKDAAPITQTLARSTGAITSYLDDLRAFVFNTSSV